MGWKLKNIWNHHLLVVDLFDLKKNVVSISETPGHVGTPGAQANQGVLQGGWAAACAKGKKSTPIGWWFKPWPFVGDGEFTWPFSRGWKRDLETRGWKGHGLNHLVGGFFWLGPSFFLFKGAPCRAACGPSTGRFRGPQGQSFSIREKFVDRILKASANPWCTTWAKGQGPLVGPKGVVGDEIRAPIIYMVGLYSWLTCCEKTWRHCLYHVKLTLVIHWCPKCRYMHIRTSQHWSKFVKKSPLQTPGY